MHTHTCTAIHTYTERGKSFFTYIVYVRENEPKRVRDENKVKEAKAESPRERLRVRRKDTVNRETQKVSESMRVEGEKKRWWGGIGMRER